MVVQTAVTNKTELEVVVTKNSSHIVLIADEGGEDVKLTAKIQSSGVDIDLVPEPTPMILLSEFASRGEGTYNYQKLVYKITPSGGTLVLPTDYTLLINFTGMVATTTYSVETMDLPTFTNQYLHYDEKNILANTSTLDIVFQNSAVQKDTHIVYPKLEMLGTKFTHISGSVTEFTQNTEEVFQALANDTTINSTIFMLVMNCYGQN